MRIKIKLSSSDGLLDINNQSMVNSFIHRCLGKDNKYHDIYSNYVVSGLRGGKWIKGTNKIDFNKGGFIIVSTIDSEFLNKLLLGLMSGIKFGYGVRFLGLDYIEERIYDGGINYFKTLTPILLKRNGEFLTINDKDFIKELEVHDRHKIKSVLVKNVINKASECQINISGSKEVCDLLYNIGIGQSCGSGFGLLYKTESKKIYQ